MGKGNESWTPGIAEERGITMQFVPIADNGGRWHHIASEEEIANCGHGEFAVYEIPMLSVTYIIHRDRLTTIRFGGSLGGGTMAIECGWVYANDLMQRLDELEIRTLSEHPANSAF